MCLYGSLVKTFGISIRHFQFEILMFGDTFHGVGRPIRDLKGKRLFVSVCVCVLSENRIVNISVGDADSDIIIFTSPYISLQPFSCDVLSIMPG